MRVKSGLRGLIFGRAAKIIRQGRIKKPGFCLPDFFGIITAAYCARQLRASVGAAGKTAGHLNIFAKTGTMSFITIFDVLMQMS